MTQANRNYPIFSYTQTGTYLGEQKKKLSRSLELTQIALGHPSVKVVSPPTSGKLILSKDQLPSVVRRQVVKDTGRGCRVCNGQYHYLQFVTICDLSMSLFAMSQPVGHNPSCRNKRDL